MNLSTESQGVLKEAVKLAAARGNEQVTSAHLALSLLDDDACIRLVEAMGSDVDSVRTRLTELLDRLPGQETPSAPSTSRDLLRILGVSEKRALDRGASIVSPVHLLISLCDGEFDAGAVLDREGLSATRLRRGLNALDKRDAECRGSADDAALIEELRQQVSDLIRTNQILSDALDRALRVRQAGDVDQ